MKRAILPVLFALAAPACAPGLAGEWRGSGDINGSDYMRFSGTFEIDETGGGVALLDIGERATVRVPLCDVNAGETRVTFTVDTAFPPARSCEGQKAPVVLQADLGEHLLSGTVLDTNRQPVGLWRAHRKLD